MCKPLFLEKSQQYNAELFSCSHQACDAHTWIHQTRILKRVFCQWCSLWTNRANPDPKIDVWTEPWGNLTAVSLALIAVEKVHLLLYCKGRKINENELRLAVLDWFFSSSLKATSPNSLVQFKTAACRWQTTRKSCVFIQCWMSVTIIKINFYCSSVHKWHLRLSLVLNVFVALNPQCSTVQCIWCCNTSV